MKTNPGQNVLVKYLINILLINTRQYLVDMFVNLASFIHPSQAINNVIKFDVRYDVLECFSFIKSVEIVQETELFQITLEIPNKQLNPLVPFAS